MRIETRRLNVQNGAEVNVSSAGAGAAGNLAVSAGSIGLDNQSSIRATTRAGDRGNITLRSPTLVLRRESQITTNATSTATGGNITLNTDVLAALENSDISANAVEGRGGNVQINSQGLFLSPDSQITASSERGVEGVVEINTPDVDPIRGLVTLPAELVDASGLIASGCADGVENEFIITGRGGLPPNPSDTLSSDAVWTDLRYRTKLALTRSISEEASQPTNPMAGQVVEAQGWVINNLGLVVLTATAPAVTRPIPWMPSAECHTP